MSLQSEAVCEIALASAEYNALPYVDNAHEATTTDDAASARCRLLGLISHHGLSDIFSVHLLHRHFDVPKAQVMLYETISGPDHPTYQVLAPRKPKDTQSLHGRYFFAAPDGSMKAYEYSTDPQPDISQYHSFCLLFWNELTRLNVQHVFALGIRPYSTLTNFTEVEIPEACTTVFVEDLHLPGSFETDWTARSKRWDEGLPLNQAKTSHGRCKRGKATHTAIGPESWATDDQGRGVLMLDGHCLPADSGAFNVLTRAMNYVTVM